jgi:hypothetical protein
MGGQFVSFDEAARGFKFTPAEGFVGTASFEVQASTSASDEGLGGEAVTAQITVAHVLGTEGDDQINIYLSDDGTMLEVYNGPRLPVNPPALTWPMNSMVPLRIHTLGGNDGVGVDLPPGANGPLGGIELDTGSGPAALHILGGSVRMDAIATGGLLTISVFAGAEMRTSGFDNVTLALVEAGAKATILAGRSTASQAWLQIAPGATLDITDNALVWDYFNATTAVATHQYIAAGRGEGGLLGKWNGTGIVSSTAAALNQLAPGAYSIGFAENGLLPLGPYSEFRGVLVDNSAVLIAFTRTGDANLDGTVDNNDVTIVGQTYAPDMAKDEWMTWALGDFDYSGFVDNDDVTLLGVFYQGQAAAGPPPNYELRSTKDEISATAGGLLTNYEGVRGRETHAQRALLGEPAVAHRGIALLGELAAASSEQPAAARRNLTPALSPGEREQRQSSPRRVPSNQWHSHGAALLDRPAVAPARAALLDKPAVAHGNDRLVDLLAEAIAGDAEREHSSRAALRLAHARRTVAADAFWEQ